MEEFKQYLSQIVPFSSHELNTFVALFEPIALKKNSYFASAGEYSTKIAFIYKGVLRAFYRNTQGNEYNKTFFTEKGIVGAYSSLITGEKSQINIQCLTDCEILVADFKNLTQLYDKYPKFERLARIFAEYFFVSKEQREIEIVMLDATERYKIFQKKHPKLETIIPQYHIASYLGITPTQLSRIRAKK